MFEYGQKIAFKSLVRLEEPFDSRSRNPMFDDRAFSLKLLKKGLKICETEVYHSFMLRLNSLEANAGNILKNSFQK
jgi:hypothetical protein